MKVMIEKWKNRHLPGESGDHLALSNGIEAVS
jgi:hypothetical protein